MFTPRLPLTPFHTVIHKAENFNFNVVQPMHPSIGYPCLSHHHTRHIWISFSVQCYILHLVLPPTLSRYFVKSVSPVTGHFTACECIAVSCHV